MSRKNKPANDYVQSPNGMTSTMMTLIKIQKEINVPKNQFNKFGNYKYRNVEDIMEAVKPLLGDCVLFFSDDVIVYKSEHPAQAIEMQGKDGKYTEIIDGDRFYVKATAVLTNGKDEPIMVSAMAREAQNKKGMDDAQITGAASSYARKYALQGLFLLDDSKDPDTQPAPEKGNRTQTSTPAQPKKEFLATPAQHKKIFALIKEAGMEAEEGKNSIKKYFKLDSFSQITSQQASKAIESLMNKVEKGEETA